MELFLHDLIHDASSPAIVKKLKFCKVSERGASVYSASNLAKEELPHMDLLFRGAVSIGRRCSLFRINCFSSILSRLQDPLSELCKIPPANLSVGMYAIMTSQHHSTISPFLRYQHDVEEKRLNSALSDIVNECVNTVGVNINAAGYSLLSVSANFDLFLILISCEM